MKNKLYTMKGDTKDLRLLPVYFKYIGLGIFIFAVIFLILAITKTILLEKETAKTLVLNWLLISFLLLSLTRSKIEDELTLRLRLRALAGAFIFGIGYVITLPYINYFLAREFIVDRTAGGILVMMLLFYNGIFFLLKSKR